LHSPGSEFADVNFVPVPVVNSVHLPEFLQLFSRGLKFAQNLSVQFHQISGREDLSGEASRGNSKNEKIKNVAWEYSRRERSYSTDCLQGEPE
jgi:hypothetical protein